MLKEEKELVLGRRNKAAVVGKVNAVVDGVRVGMWATSESGRLGGVQGGGVPDRGFCTESLLLRYWAALNQHGHLLLYLLSSPWSPVVQSEEVSAEVR